MTREELMADDTQYCCYCGGEKVRFQCCGENHFHTFAQMSAEEQDEFLDNEECAPLYTSPQRHKPWVGLTDEEIWSVYTQVDSMQYMEFSHAIEAKLQEKNNG
jgi:hypothetical protein